MNQRQKLFVKHYLIDPNATKAAIAAGYSEKTARIKGSQLLTKVNVLEAIEAGQAKRAEKLEITAEYVLANIREIGERCKLPGEEFNPTAALKAQELLGKHIGMFTERVEHSGAIFELGEIEQSKQDGDSGRRASLRLFTAN